MSLGMIEKKKIFFSHSKQALGRFPARILFSLHFISFSSWVLLPHSELLSATSTGASSSGHHFPLSGGVLFLPWEEAIAQQGLNWAQVGWEQYTPSKFKSERNLKSKGCVHIISSFKTFSHFSRADLLLFNPLNCAKT